RHAALAVILDHRLQRILVDRADVEVAVGGEDHPVHTTLDEALFGLRIGQFDARAAIGGTASVELVDGCVDGGVLVAGGGGQGDAGVTGVGDDRHVILVTQFAHQLFQR